MASYNKRITYFGIVRSVSSWSKVAREMLKSLSSLGVGTNIYERKGFLYDRDFDLGELAGKVDNRFSGEAVFTFEHPRNYAYLPEEGKRIGFLVYEFTVLPPLWVENINKYLDLVFVPSRFTAEVFLKSGVDKNKLRTLRYGVNPEFYYPAPSPGPEFRLLCVGSPQKREGVADALESFAAAFPAGHDAKLTLKLSYNVSSAKSFETAGFKEMLAKYSRLLGEKLEIIDKELSEKEMGALYRRSSAYFSLSRAESFGLPFLESVACGRPVIAMNHSGQEDFLDEGNACFVEHELSPASGEEYEKLSVPQYVARPRPGSAAETLRKVYAEKDNPLIPKLKGGAERYHWVKIAEEFLGLI